MVPLQANMASPRTVLPEDACPTRAKLRIFAEGCVAIAPRMKLKCLVCKLRETKALISRSVQRSRLIDRRSPFSIQDVQSCSFVAQLLSLRETRSLRFFRVVRRKRR